MENNGYGINLFLCRPVGSRSLIWGDSIATNDNDARAKNSRKDPVNGKRQQTLDLMNIVSLHIFCILVSDDTPFTHSLSFTLARSCEAWNHQNDGGITTKGMAMFTLAANVL